MVEKVYLLNEQDLNNMVDEYVAYFLKHCKYIENQDGSRNDTEMGLKGHIVPFIARFFGRSK